MDRRTLLERAGAVVGAVAVAGCGSVALPERLSGWGGDEQEGTQGTTEATTGESDVEAEAATSRATADRSDDESTAQSTTTQSTTTARSTPTRTATARPTPEPPANRLLAPEVIGTRWDYAAGSTPSERGNGTITAVYETTRGTEERLRIRLWPCEGESLEDLGGTCSLGNLPERYRAMSGVETATPAVGETAFAWWEGDQTDIEVVANEHVFRITYTVPESGTTAANSATSRPPALQRVIEIARQQTDALAAFV